MMKRVSTIILCVIGIVLVTVSHGHATTAEAAIRKQIDEQPSYVLDSRPLRLMSLGFDNLAADAVWLKAVQYIGSHYLDNRFEELPAYLDTVTDLDPQFKGAYKLGLILLPEIGKQKEAIALGLKGIKELPDDPELPYYLAYDYFQYEHDYTAAAQWFSYAAALPDAFPSARTLAALNLAKTGEYAVAEEVWMNIHETTDDPVMLDTAKIRLERIRNLQSIAAALTSYRQSLSEDPGTLDDLVRAGFIAAIPPDPVETIEYFLNPLTGLPDVQRKL